MRLANCREANPARVRMRWQLLVTRIKRCDVVRAGSQRPMGCCRGRQKSMHRGRACQRHVMRCAGLSTALNRSCARRVERHARRASLEVRSADPIRVEQIGHQHNSASSAGRSSSATLPHNTPHDRCEQYVTRAPEPNTQVRAVNAKRSKATTSELRAGPAFAPAAANPH
jgi:hypothetical protein